MSNSVGLLRSVDRTRRRWVARIRSAGRLTVASSTVIGGTPRIMRGATLRVGERTGLGPGCRCMASVTIGDDCLISADVRFVGDDHPIHVAGRMNEAPSMFPRKVVVGDDVLIGAGAIVVGPANVGTGAVIAAGAVVTGDVAPRSIMGGVPARVIGERRQP